MQHLETAISLAMEEYRQLSAQANRVYDSILQLSSAPLTLEAAMEADRLNPQSNALADYFAPGTQRARRQIALEGMLEGLRNLYRRILAALQQVMQRVVAWIKQLLGTKKTDERERQLAEAHKREQEIKDALEKAQRDFDQETEQRQRQLAERNERLDQQAREREQAASRQQRDQEQDEAERHNRDKIALSRAQHDLDQEQASRARQTQQANAADDDQREREQAAHKAQQAEKDAKLKQAQDEFDAESTHRQQTHAIHNVQADSEHHKHQAHQQSQLERAQQELDDADRQRQANHEKEWRAEWERNNALMQEHRQRMKQIGTNIDSFVQYVLEESSKDYPSALHRLLTEQTESFANLAQGHGNYWSDLEHLHGMINQKLASWVRQVNEALGKLDVAVGFITFRDSHAGTNEVRVKDVLDAFDRVLQDAPLPNGSKTLAEVVNEMHIAARGESGRSTKPLVYTLVQKTATDAKREHMFQEARKALQDAAGELERASQTLGKLQQAAREEIHAKLDSQGNSTLSEQLKKSLHDLALQVVALQGYASEWAHADELFGKVVSLYCELQKGLLVEIRHTKVPLSEHAKAQVK